MDSKMQSLTARVLKIDFNYKLATKIHVWMKQGYSFAPYRCIVTIQNEDALTVFWKGLKLSESFSEIKMDLIRLRHRLNRNLAASKAVPRNDLPENTTAVTGVAVVTVQNGPTEQSVKVVYVDNCCNVVRMIRQCFPGVDVKLDAFHWMKRWNDVTDDNKSPQAGVMRALLHRALFMVPPDVFAATKAKLFSTDDIVCSISSSFTGIHRAERLMYQFFEEKNHSKMVIRLGCSDHGTCHTEKLLLINSYVKSLGYPVDKTPFKDVSAPTRRSEKEYMGFSYCLPTSVHEVSNPTEGAARDSTERRIVDDDDENHDNLPCQDQPSRRRSRL